jgi:membrane-associated phospholipid phosphatase
MVRRRLGLRPTAVLTAGTLAPLAACVALPPGRRRQAAVCVLNMWAYLAAYEMPNDDPEALRARVRVAYPIAIDTALGLGATPTIRLQRAFARPGAINRFERVLVWCHWLWFLVPHASVIYVLVRDPDRAVAAASRMYAVFDLGAVFYWTIPTAPPWWAASEGRLEGAEDLHVRRMMIEYGEQFWGSRWTGLYSVLGGNPLAAMPSLHFATSLMAAHLLSEVGPVAGAIGWGYAATLGLALVYLGEHYAADLLAGAGLTEGVRLAASQLEPVLQRPGAGRRRPLRRGWRAGARLQLGGG